MNFYKLNEERALEPSTEEALFASGVPGRRSFWVDINQPNEEALGRLLTRLDRYLIADDVTLSDISDRWHLHHALGMDLQNSML